MEKLFITFVVTYIFSTFLIGCNLTKSAKNSNTKNSTVEKVNDIPKDIIAKLKHDFKSEKEQAQAIKIVQHIKNDTLNVGWIQLSRAVIILSAGDLEKMKAIVESNYYEDPRDVIMKMMALPNNTNNYGNTPFTIEQ
jgi:hypothetical protein